MPTINNIEVEDTFSELFDMWCARVIITAKTEELVQYAVNSATGFATSIIMCPCEAGVDVFLPRDRTPDNRPGASIMFFTRNKKDLKHVLLERLSQCLLTAPTTAVFNGLTSNEVDNTGSKISYFGDGWQKKEKRFNRNISTIPMMDGEFIIENSFNLAEGVAGGNLLILGKDVLSSLNAAKKAVQAMLNIPYVITPFPGGICRSGSKIGSKYKGLIASINHQYCPTLKNIVEDSKIPSNVNCVYEIVINGRTLQDVKKAMGAGIKSAVEVSGVIKITSANYGGKLGDKKIFLKDII